MSKYNLEVLEELEVDSLMTTDFCCGLTSPILKIEKIRENNSGEISNRVVSRCVRCSRRGVEFK